MSVEVTTSPAKTSAMVQQEGDATVTVPPGGVILIHIARHIAATRIENSAALQPHLECSVKQFELGGEYGFLQRDEMRRFHWYEEDCFFFAAGLAPRISTELTQQGFRVDVLDHTRWSQHSRIDRSLLTDATVEASERNLLTALAASPRGQVSVRGRNRAVVACMVCQLFPAASILIVVNSIEEQDYFYASLSELDRPVFTRHNLDWSAEHKIAIITTSIFSCVNDLDWNVVIFASPEAAVARQSYDRAGYLEDQLLYCLTPPEYRTDRCTELRLESICGPEIWSEADPRARVNVVFVPSPSSTIQSGLSGLDRKSQAIWHNNKRNDAIAELADAIVMDDEQTLSRRSENLAQLQAPSAASSPRTAILVDSSEHGRQLAERLPDWKLIAAIPDEDGLIADGNGPNNLEIISEAMAASDGIDADVILCASGCPSVARNFPPQRAAPVLIVDFADEFDEQARQETRQRIEAYRQRGWTVQSVIAPDGGER